MSSPLEEVVRSGQSSAPTVEVVASDDFSPVTDDLVARNRATSASARSGLPAAPALKVLNLGKTQVTDVGKRQLDGLKMLRRGLQIIDDDDVFKLASFADFKP